jgi:PPOX class probable F420-dependent enzyme
MTPDQALAFARTRDRGVLTTLHRDGRPHLSNVLVAWSPDGPRPVISVTSSRVKTRNLLRDPRAALHVTDDSFWKYVVLDGRATVSDPATSPDDEVADRLVEYYRQLSGEHPDWQEYREAMVADSRRLVTLDVTSAYGRLPD